jgi:hypothetical protein
MDIKPLYEMYRISTPGSLTFTGGGIARVPVHRRLSDPDSQLLRRKGEPERRDEA